MTPFAGERLERVGGARVPELGEVGVAKERRVVDRELRVERAHLALRRDDQRVDLAEHRVGLDEAAVEPLEDLRDLAPLAGIADAGEQLAGVVGLVALERVDVHPRELLGALGGDLLDLDAALRREHQQRLLGAPVEGDREVVLLRDLGGPLDPEPLDDVAANVEAEDLRGLALGVVRVTRELDPARLAAPAGQHLRLDDDGPAELGSRLRASAGVVATRPPRPGCRSARRAPCPGTRRGPPDSDC